MPSRRLDVQARKGAEESKPLNRSLGAAKATKQDEFYTQLSDIERELRHYTKYFKNKRVLCNCAVLWRKRHKKFERLGIRPLQRRRPCREPRYFPSKPSTP
ncbi:MAG: hypothetical protein H0V18_05925 [Pyrinomonadaceae bacterium]|nr:hypothetical protein [Pyrinomonadaceae bacterium]